VTDFGKAFQDVLELSHTSYRSLGRAEVLFMGTRARPRRDKESGELVWTSEESMPDYVGCIHRPHGPGAFVCFDAKTTNETSWKLPVKMQHQQRTLADFAAAGGICFFAVEFRALQRCYLDRVFWADRDGRASVRPRGILPNRPLIVAPTNGLYDWLSIVETYWLPSR
jgi:penicillin-binding protein-related factor A (putative recombinase)